MTTGAGNIDNTEIIDLSGNCTASFSNYPMKLRGTTGQLLNDSVVICGGWSSVKQEFIHDCFILRKGATSFENFLSMNICRSNAKSIINQGYIWITGGADGSKIFSSTEYIPKSSINDLSLPISVQSHAIIVINETISMLIGGAGYGGSTNTYYFNHQSKTWKAGPYMMTGRNQHTAGLIRDHVTHSQHIVVVGGFGALDSVELLHDTQRGKGIYFCVIQKYVYTSDFYLL